jgi:hypothetical protein
MPVDLHSVVSGGHTFSSIPNTLDSAYQWFSLPGPGFGTWPNSVSAIGSWQKRHWMTVGGLMTATNIIEEYKSILMKLLGRFDAFLANHEMSGDKG